MIDSPKTFLDAISSCDLLFEGEVISRESIIRTAMEFFGEGFFSSVPRRRTLLHTGSIAFDATALFLSSLADILVFFERNNDDFWANIHIGEKPVYVLYTDPNTGESTRCEVLDLKLGEYLVVTDKQKCRAVPYSQRTMLWNHPDINNFSRNTGGEGVGRRVGAPKAHKDFERLFGIKALALRQLVTHTVVVVDREHAEEYAKHLYTGIAIRYQEEYTTRTIALKDIIGAIYGSDEDQANWHSLGGDKSSENPVLRFCPKLSIARRMLGRSGSMLLLSGTNLLRDQEVFREVSTDTSPNFIFASLPIGAWYSFERNSVRWLLDSMTADGGKLLAFTKPYLTKFEMPALPIRAGAARSSIVEELRRQIRQSRDWTINCRFLEGFLSAEDYGEWMGALRYFNGIPFDKIQKINFLIQVRGLFSFLCASVFDTRTLDEHPEWTSLRNHPYSPAKKLEEIKQTCSRLPDDNIKQAGFRLYGLLEKAYQSSLADNEKQKALEQILWGPKRSRRPRTIAVIVPKAGFKVLCEHFGWINRARERKDRLEIATADNFRPANTRYDLIVSIGASSGKSFSPFFCTCADSIEVLLYGCEIAFFKACSQNSERLEGALNGEQWQDDTLQSDMNAQFNRELDAQIEAFRAQENQRFWHRLRQQGNRRGQVPVSEVVWMGTLEETGEVVFFTKYCHPYVMEADGLLTEKSMEHLVAGDTILFMRNTEERQDILDIMLQEHISTLKDDNLAEEFKRSKYWREVLKKYVEESQLTLKEVAKQIGVNPSTIKNWLDDESHIVGPWDFNLESIANITGDKEMQGSIKSYCDACTHIRSMRRTMLEKLGRQIRGDVASTRYKDMIRLCVLEDLQKLPEPIRMETRLVNHPISKQTEGEET